MNIQQLQDENKVLREKLANSLFENKDLRRKITKLKEIIMSDVKQYEIDTPAQGHHDFLMSKLRWVIERYFSVNIGVKCRKREIIDGRRMMYNWLADNTHMALKQIGNSVGLMQDHSTVIHAKREHSDIYETNKGYRKDYDEICRRMKVILEAKRNEDLTHEPIINAS